MGQRARVQPSSRCPCARRRRQTASGTLWCLSQEDTSVQLYRTFLLIVLLGVPMITSRGAVAQVPQGMGEGRPLTWVSGGSGNGRPKPSADAVAGEMTVDDLVAQALADNPDLQATRAEVD